MKLCSDEFIFFLDQLSHVALNPREKVIHTRVNAWHHRTTTFCTEGSDSSQRPGGIAATLNQESATGVATAGIDASSTSTDLVTSANGDSRDGIVGVIAIGGGNQRHFCLSEGADSAASIRGCAPAHHLKDFFSQLKTIILLGKSKSFFVNRKSQEIRNSAQIAKFKSLLLS